MRRVVGRKDRRLALVVFAVVVIAVVGIIGYGVVVWNEGVSASDRGVAGTDEQVAEDERNAVYEECRRGVIVEHGDPEFQSFLRRSFTNLRIKKACGSLFGHR
jgi:hypothetical protein